MQYKLWYKIGQAKNKFKAGIYHDENKPVDAAGQTLGLVLLELEAENDDLAYEKVKALILPDDNREVAGRSYLRRCRSGRLKKTPCIINLSEVSEELRNIIINNLESVEANGLLIREGNRYRPALKHYIEPVKEEETVEMTAEMTPTGTE